jgi:hypothetical protein
MLKSNDCEASMATLKGNYGMTANIQQPMDSGGTPTGDTSSSAPPPIDQNPQAMECIDKLKQMGYTADDVEQAMGGGDDSQDQSQSAAQPAKSSMAIPSMG